ncbi:ABC transporter permease [Curtobacterium sp. MCSS17_011]|nr:ABC transporter permease [Curtobacterium sp. MCSS17_011]
MAVFLVIPLLVNVWTALHDDAGAWSVEAFARLVGQQYRSAFLNTAALSATTAVLGGLLGLVLAWAIATSARVLWLRDLLLSFSGVASQFAGVPLAFAFVAAIGVQGVVTSLVRDLTGWDLANSFSLSSFGGLTVVYLYFQAPLMTVLVLPAVAGMRTEWSESATSLGANRLQYLRDVALPILAPAVGGAALLLFANSFSAYATAYALAGGGANLVAILVGFFISGNVLIDESFAAALATGMIVVVAVAMTVRWALSRRSSRWLR